MIADLTRSSKFLEDELKKRGIELPEGTSTKVEKVKDKNILTEIYEIRAKGFLSTKSTSIGYFYFDEAEAEKTCKQLNEKLNVYFVQPIEMKDTLKLNKLEEI